AAAVTGAVSARSRISPPIINPVAEAGETIAGKTKSLVTEAPKTIREGKGSPRVGIHHGAVHHGAIHHVEGRQTAHHIGGHHVAIHVAGHHVGGHHVGRHHAAHHVGVHHHLPAAHPHSSPALSLCLGKENKHGQTSRGRPEQFFHESCHSFSLPCLSPLKENSNPATLTLAAQRLVESTPRAVDERPSETNAQVMKAMRLRYVGRN